MLFTQHKQESDGNQNFSEHKTTLEIPQRTCYIYRGYATVLANDRNIMMSASLPRSSSPIQARPARDSIPRRLIVTASVVIFAIRDWSLWMLLRDGPWGPPMRLVLGTESVTDAVERTIEALLMWPANAPIIQMKAGWQEQQVYVWGSTEQGS